MNLKTGGVGNEMDKLRTSIARLRKDLRQLNQAGGTPGKKPSPADQNEGRGGILSQIFMPKLLRLLPKELQKLTNKIGPAGAAIGGLGMYVAAVGKRWFAWYSMILDTRREMGLTLPEAQAFGAEVLSMTGRFGIAMDRVANIARFVGQGTDIARNGVVRLAADLALTGAASKTAEQDMAKFGFFLHRTLEMAAEQASAVSDAVMGVAKNANVPLKNLQTDLMAGSKAIFQAQQDVGGPKAVAAFAALAAGMRQAGAESDQIAAVFGSMGEKGSKLFQLFAGSRFQMEPFRKQLANINEGIKTGAIAAASLGDVYEKLGPNTLSKLAQSVQDTKSDMDEFFRIFEMTPEQREAWKRSFLTPMQRIKMAFTQFWADQTQAVNSLIGGPMDSFLNKLAEISEVGVSAFDILTKKVGEDLYLAWEHLLKGPVTAFFEDLKWLYNKVFENPVVGKRISAPPAPPGTASWLEGKPWLATPPSTPTGVTSKWAGAKPMPTPPQSEAPGVKKDPSVELLREQLGAQRANTKMLEEYLKRQELESLRRGGGSGGGNNSGQPVNPYVEAQRS